VTNRPGTAVATAAALGALLLAGFTTAGCTTAANAHWRTATGPSGAPVGGSGLTSAASPVTVVPAANAKSVSVTQPVVVSAAGSTRLTSVQVAAGSGSIAGALSADGHTWTSTGSLRFGTRYTVTVSAADAMTTSSFTTLKPAHTVTPTLDANAMLALRDGGTYGIGEPVIVHFSRSVPASARARVQRALHVTTTPAVPGRWRWIDGQNVHYRGAVYWATGTTIKINANMYGLSLGNGTYGARNASATIHIGASHIAVADNTTHHMKVYVSGTMVRDIPVSLGSGKSAKGDHGQLIDFWTRSGPHVVIIKTPSHVMSSASYGLTDKNSPFYYAPETIYDTVRISYAGEFVHKRTWSLGQIGHVNTSHGCINVGPENAKWIYDLLIPGDIVDVTGTPKTLPLTDGLGDWTIPWSKW
jgi:lipoprotein-anchoring transpeptidase ErfK/SrfK